MADTDTLIENGTVITMDPQRQVLKETSVAVAGGRIVDIGPPQEMRARHRGAKTIDARRKAIMPGLIDLHAHAGQELLKSVGEHLPGFEWRNLMDFVSIVGVGPSRPPWPREYSYWDNGRRVDRLVTLEESLERTTEAIKGWQARKSELVQLWVSVSRLLNENSADPVYDPANAPYIRPQAEGVRRIMDETGCGLHVHAYGTSVKYADQEDFGLLGPKTVLAHGWPFDLETVEILARTDTRVGHCPRAHRVYMFKGRCPVPEMIDAGVIVGLASDAPALDRSFNLWEDMFLAPRWQRRELNDARLIPPGKALEMATIDGARALGMEDRIGSIEVGKEADIIIVDLFKPHIAPVFMEPSRLAHYARGADVDTVMVRGQVLMQNRVVRTVDENEVMERAQELGEQTIEMFRLEPLAEHPDRYWRYSRE